MKVRKNLEAVFIAASVMATFAAYATADAPVTVNAKPALVSQSANDVPMQVVVIKAERMSEAEKAAQN